MAAREIKRLELLINKINNIVFHDNKKLKNMLDIKEYIYIYIFRNAVMVGSRAKKNLGQFYTTNSEYIMNGLQLPFNSEEELLIVEPFAGKGDLIDWAKKTCGPVHHVVVESYDIEPKRDDIQKRDTLLEPPNYAGSWIITNPPYLARNKSCEKGVFDKYNTNDLYKCFIMSVVQQNNCKGGIFIIPAGFFFSPRDLDVRCRSEFMSRYRITKVRYFEETVFDDTTTTIVAVSFVRSDIVLTSQNVEWNILPANTTQTFHMSSVNDWIIGGEIYCLPVPKGISVRRYVVGQVKREGEQQTFITLNALDSGTKSGRIALEYKKGYLYPAKDCSRTYATFCVMGITLSEEDQIAICESFNEYLEKKRFEYWSLFLPQFRESKEYARKRIPFELAYRIFLNIILQRKSV